MTFSPSQVRLCATTDRVVLRYGTCSLLCRDPNEQQTHNSNVRAEEALMTLLQTVLETFTGGA